LGYAVANNKEEACRILLNEIKKRNDFSQEKFKLWLEGQDDQSRPLIMTAIKGLTNIMKLLLLSGAVITKKENCLDVLHVAAIHNNSEFLENYINYVNTTSWQLNINVTDSEGNSAIHLAVKKDDIRFQEVLKVLLNFGADINMKNNKSETPLQIATSNENNDLIKFLLSCNADLYCQNQQGETFKELLNKNCHFDDDINLNIKRLLFSAVKNNDHERLKTFLSDKFLDVMNIVDEPEAYEYTSIFVINKCYILLYFITFMTK
jgi:ankyrin repeat protein